MRRAARGNARSICHAGNSLKNRVLGWKRKVSGWKHSALGRLHGVSGRPHRVFWRLHGDSGRLHSDCGRLHSVLGRWHSLPSGRRLVPGRTRRFSGEEHSRREPAQSPSGRKRKVPGRLDSLCWTCGRASLPQLEVWLPGERREARGERREARGERSLQCLDELHTN